MTQTNQDAAPPTKKKVMPDPSPTALSLQNTDPEQLLDGMPLEVAQKIVGEWRTAKEAPGLPKARPSSIVQYVRNSGMLELKYSRELNLEYGSLSPIEVLKRFFLHARELKPESWRLYRYGLLYTLNDRAIKMEEKGLPQQSLIIALASLIVVSKQPYRVLEQTQIPKKNNVLERPKSIKAKYFEQLMTHLGVESTTKNVKAKRAHSFAIATAATGMRPTEWKDAIVRDATYQDVPLGKSPEGLLAIVVNTAKRKDSEASWERTILIDSIYCKNHILQHFNEMRASMEQSVDPIEPDKKYIRKSSGAIREACKELWPQNPERWITLYTLRSQARANIASVYGGYIAAAMLGHSPEKSEDYYAGSHRANLPRGAKLSDVSIPVPQPGANCMAKAEEFIARRHAAAAEKASQILAADNRASAEAGLP